MTLADIIALIDKATEERRGVPAANMAALLPAAREAAATIEQLQADLAALRIEHTAWGAIIDATRADRDRAREQLAEYRDVHGRIRDALGGDTDIAVENLARVVIADRDATRAEAATLRAEVADAKVRADAIETERMWAVSAFHRTRQERDAARAEVATLRAQVAEAHQAGRVAMREEMQAWADDALDVMRSAAQMNERAATDAARKAERADVVAWLRSGDWPSGPTWQAIKNCIDQSADAIERGAHEGAATPK